MPKGIDHFKVVVSDQAAGAMKDPDFAEAIRETLARIRHALCDVDTNDHAAIDAAMEEFGATRVDPDDFPEDDHGDGEEGNSDSRG